MRTRGGCLALAAAAALGCGPGLAGEGGGESEGETAATADSGDGDSGDGDGDSGDGDGDSGDGDGDSGDGDGDGDDPPCGPQELLCPDGSCQLDLGNPDPCCGYGGSCPEGCEPQDASSTEDGCDQPLYAWTGIGCAAICACEGPDCAELHASVGACLEAHEPTCGSIGLATCPFELPLGPTNVAGTTSLGAHEYTVGSFGQVFGEGSPVLNIVLARDLLTLGNQLWAGWDAPETADVLKIWGGAPMPGEYQVDVSVPILQSEWAIGTLTITELLIDGEPQMHELRATLAVDDGEWQLGGEIAIRGCLKLEMHLP